MKRFITFAELRSQVFQPQFSVVQRLTPTFFRQARATALACRFFPRIGPSPIEIRGESAASSFDFWRDFVAEATRA